MWLVRGVTVYSCVVSEGSDSVVSEGVTVYSCVVSEGSDSVVSEGSDSVLLCG